MTSPTWKDAGDEGRISTASPAWMAGPILPLVTTMVFRPSSAGIEAPANTKKAMRTVGIRIARGNSLAILLERRDSRASRWRLPTGTGSIAASGCGCPWWRPSDATGAVAGSVDSSAAGTPRCSRSWVLVPSSTATGVWHEASRPNGCRSEPPSGVSLSLSGAGGDLA